MKRAELCRGSKAGQACRGPCWGQGLYTLQRASRRLHRSALGATEPVSRLPHLWETVLGSEIGSGLWGGAVSHSGPTLLRKRFFTTLTTSPSCLGNTLWGQEELGHSHPATGGSLPSAFF